MVSFEEIDDYLKDVLNVKTKAEFEQRIIADNEFAERVAFYLNFVRVARETNNETKKTRFKEIYYQTASTRQQAGVRKMWPYVVMMAAVVATLFVGIYLYTSSSTSPTKMADVYITENFKSLGTEMGASQDEFNKGKALFNDNADYQAALDKFDEVIKSDPENTDAIEFAGISAVKLQQYDKAIGYFQSLAARQNLKENPGKSYEALTLIKRNKGNDAEVAKQLLNEVKAKGLAGSDKADKFLNSF